MFFKQKFKIFFDNGNMVETDDLLGWIKSSVIGNAERFYFKMKWLCKYDKKGFWYHTRNDSNGYVDEFYLYTDNNVMVSPELFKAEYFSKQNRDYWDHIDAFNSRFRNRQWRKKHTTTYERKMKTFAERKAIAGVEKDDGEPEFRGRRRAIPNPWDDICTRKSLSWKNCTKRKRQHKGS